MNSNLPPVFGSISSLFRNPLPLFSGFLLCVASVTVSGQSVSFAGARIILPATGLITVTGVAVDSAGNVFIANAENDRFDSGHVLELPRTTTGYGPQIDLTPQGLSSIWGIALDSEGNVFFTDSGSGVFELPHTSTGYGLQITLPFSGLKAAYGVTVDSAGNVFVADFYYNNRVVELPKTSTGRGSQTTLPFSGLSYLYGVAVDSAGNVFAANVSGLQELPWTSTGYGPQTTLPAFSTGYPIGVAVDSAGNVFFSDTQERVAELLRTSTGYALPITLPSISYYYQYIWGVAVDTGGDVFAESSELQIIPPVNFQNAYACAPGRTTPAPCNRTLTLNYNVEESGTLGTPKVLTGGAPDLDFTLASGSTCAGAVKKGTVCTVNVTFAPLAVGTRDGSVEITDGSGTALTATTVNGVGDSVAGVPPMVQLSTNSLAFYTIPLGATKTLPLTVTNVGGGTLTIDSTSFSGHSYTIAENTCGGGLTTGNSCTLQVLFSPMSSGYHDEVLTLQTNVSPNPIVYLRGRAIGLRISGAPLEFGRVPYGAVVVLPLTVTNFGVPGTLMVSTSLAPVSAPSYKVLTTARNTCLAGIMTNQSCTLPVQFSPVSVGAHNAILTVTPSDGGQAITVGLQGIEAPCAAQCQSVTFAGAQSVLPTSGLSFPDGVAVDSTGDLFVADASTTSVMELPWTGTGFGPQTTLPFSGLISPDGVAVDSTGDLFVADASTSNSVVELPWTGTDFGPQTTLPFNGLDGPDGVAVDSAGDVFIADRLNDRVVELPKTPTGYGPQTTLPFTGLAFPGGVALDSAGDLFIAEYDGSVLELPKTATGYGLQVTLPTNGLSFPEGVAVDSTGDVFITDSGNNRVVELPKAPTGYEAGATLPFSGLNHPLGITVDSAWDVFIADAKNNRVVELQTGSVNFGGANVCAPGSTTPPPCSQTLTLNFSVNADATLGIPEVHTGGAPKLDFTLASGSTCTGALTRGSTCIVNVSFAPLTAGFRYGSVQITANGAVLAATPLSGFGILATTGPPVAQISTSYLPFGTVPFGTSKALPLTIANIGGGTLTVAPSISGSSNFTIAGSTCGAGVASGNTCTLKMKFSPTSIATHDGLLTLQTNGAANPSIGLHGVANGLSVLGGVSGAFLEFGSVSSGSTEVLPLTVTNIGLPGTVTVGTTITVRSTPTPTTTYQVLTTAQNTCLAGIAPGQSCTLPVEFSPTSSGTHDDLLTLTPTPGGGATTVWLTGSTP